MALHSVQALCPSLDGEVKIGKRMASSFKLQATDSSPQTKKAGPQARLVLGTAVRWQIRDSAVYGRYQPPVERPATGLASGHPPSIKQSFRFCLTST
jgi:hypothetical protein